GIGRVVIRTREYLAAVLPRGDALVMMVLRFAQELVDPEEYKLPEGKSTKWKISEREVEMAEQLIESMTGEWEPDQFKDDFRLRLQKVIEDRVRSKKVVQGDEEEDERPPEGAATNVIDFAELLKRSLDKKGGKGGGAKSGSGGKAAKKSTKKAAKKSSKKAAKQASSTRKSTTRKAG